MTGYYDYVLGLIPAALIGITAVLTLVGLSSLMALLVGASIALGLMGHAMFVRAPVDPVGPADLVAPVDPSGPVDAAQSAARTPGGSPSSHGSQ